MDSRVVVYSDIVNGGDDDDDDDDDDKTKIICHFLMI